MWSIGRRRSAYTSEQQARITKLATYNSERARGLVHTPEWRAQMVQLQAWFDQFPHPWLSR